MAFSSSNSPGMETVEKEKEAIDKAKVVMIAVSPNYVASDEFVELVAYAKAAGKKVVPLISQPTNLVGTPIETLVYLPRDGKALSEMSQAQKDLAFAGERGRPGIVQEIRATAGIKETAGPSPYR